MMNPVEILMLSASLEIFVSCLLGLLLLIPMQPWGRNFLSKVRNVHDLRSTHLDWLMLAFMQLGAAFVLSKVLVDWPFFTAWLLVFGGWLNPLPYLVRGLWGINAFSLSGGGKQIFFASLGLLSVLSILAGWFLILLKFI